MANYGMPTVGFHTNPERAEHNGRPKLAFSFRSTLKDMAEQKIEGKTRRERIAEALLKACESGSVRAISEFLDRLEGKAPQAFGTFDEQGDFQAQPMVVQFIRNDVKAIEAPAVVEAEKPIQDNTVSLE